MIRARWLGRRAEPAGDAPAGAPPPPWLAQEFRHDADRPGTWSAAPYAPIEVADPPCDVAAGLLVLLVPNPAPGPPWAVAFADC